MAKSTPFAFSMGQHSSRKRPADSENTQNASKVAKTQTSATRAGADGNDDLNLVYPFWLQNSTSGGGGGGSGGNPSLNPPFIDPNGPLYVQNSLLYVKTTAPIEVENKSLSLAYDSSLAVDAQNQLQVKVDTEGPIRISPDGLDIAVDPSTLEVDDEWELTVKLDPAGPISSSAAGINIRVDDTLLVEDDDTAQVKELGVHLNPTGPITADQDGLDLEVDPQTLTVTNSGATGGVLGVLLKPSGGLQTSSQGIGVALADTLTISSNTIEVKTAPNGSIGSSSDGIAVTTDPAGPLTTSSNGLSLKLTPNGSIQSSSTGLSVQTDPAGPITSGANGLSLSYDTSDFTVSQGMLSIIRNPSTYPNAYLVSGTNLLNNYTAYAENSSNYKFNCAYFLQSWYSNGLVTSSLYLKINRDYLTSLPSGQLSENAKYFTFWVPTYNSMNLSNVATPTITPSSVPWGAFLPAQNCTSNPAFKYYLTQPPSIYFEPESGSVQTFQPVLTGDWDTNTYNPGTVQVCILPQTVVGGQSTFVNMTCYNFRCQNPGIFKVAASSGTFTIGPIFYSCPTNELTQP
ncbi:fiber protein [Fowl aviadenovirus D]|uniref:Fiber protein n=1 Tax=Fowl aviadenovirus D TaxID=190064 RepID=A0A650C0P6_9ADEN|nr:fiber protein [Fowl aviadenovirus D]CUT98189.1 fiber protein [Fowl adenovirus]